MGHGSKFVATAWMARLWECQFTNWVLHLVNTRSVVLHSPERVVHRVWDFIHTVACVHGYMQVEILWGHLAVFFFHWSNARLFCLNCKSYHPAKIHLQISLEDLKKNILQTAVCSSCDVFKHYNSFFLHIFIESSSNNRHVWKSNRQTHALK